MKLPTTMIKLISLFIGMTLMSVSNVAFSLDLEQHEDKPVPLKTLFLTKLTRDKIDKQREAYLHPVVEKKRAKILPKNTSDAGKPKVKRIYIPPKVEISAVLVKPDGSTLIRVNDKYNYSPSKHINMDFAGSSSDGVPVTVQGKTKLVPVGSTLLTRQNRLVKTYKLDVTARKKSLPKTVQKAVQERLEQVQILMPK